MYFKGSIDSNYLILNHGDMLEPFSWKMVGQISIPRILKIGEILLPSGANIVEYTEFPRIL